MSYTKLLTVWVAFSNDIEAVVSRTSPVATLLLTSGYLDWVLPAHLSCTLPVGLLRWRASQVSDREEASG
ncbi:MAG: hypothetical protein RR254_07690, partial [Muribaculaceae bacterium]